MNENPGFNFSEFLLHRLVAGKRLLIGWFLPNHVPACDISGIHSCRNFTLRSIFPAQAGIQALPVLQKVANQRGYQKGLQAPE